MEDQIIAEEPAQQTITAAQFAAKFKAKREIHIFLTHDSNAYLPHHTTVTI